MSHLTSRQLGIFYNSVPDSENRTSGIDRIELILLIEQVDPHYLRSSILHSLLSAFCFMDTESVNLGTGPEEAKDRVRFS